MSKAIGPITTHPFKYNTLFGLLLSPRNPISQSQPDVIIEHRSVNLINYIVSEYWTPVLSNCRHTTHFKACHYATTFLWCMVHYIYAKAFLNMNVITKILYKMYKYITYSKLYYDCFTNLLC